MNNYFYCNCSDFIIRTHLLYFHYFFLHFYFSSVTMSCQRQHVNNMEITKKNLRNISEMVINLTTLQSISCIVVVTFVCFKEKSTQKLSVCMKEK